MKFYTNFYSKGNTVVVRGYVDGKRFNDKIKYQPTLYVPSKQGHSEYHNIYGEPVEPIEFSEIREARDFYRQYEDVSGFTIYGSNLYAYTCLNEYYGSNFDVDAVKIAYLDIEVSSEDGFPEPQQANAPLTVITVGVHGRYFSFGIGEYTAASNKERYLNFPDEKQLLKAFLKFWRYTDADIISGWNVAGFDIPYLYNRIKKVLGEKEAKMLSPVDMISERTYTQFNKTQVDYTLIGVSVLDYLDLYKKFTYSQQESYRLDHIASVELGERKLDYHELGFDTLNEFYKGDYQNYVAYNIRDVALVERIEDKMRLIEQAMVIAYDAKVNYADVFTQVRMWDVLIHNYLIEQKVVVPPKNNNSKNEQYAGAYVKEPQVGKHDWVMSFDLNSLYPHLIMQYNISPETFVEGEYVDVNIDKVISGQQIPAHTELSVSANGFAYLKNKQGFLPAMMQRMYDERVIYKKKMLEAQTALENAKKSGDKDAEKQAVKDISRYKNLQLAKKVQLNSAYGAIGNEYFRFFDVRMAESITLSGQLSIRWIERKMNDYLNKLLKTDAEDFVIASDTDSLYIRFGELVNKLYPEETDPVKIVDFLDRVAKQKIEPYIDKSYQQLVDVMGAYQQKMFMKRESIADKAIWTGKKRYILNVYDNEGVRYAEPKLKMMGIEAIKSSTPSACREKMKDAFKLIMNSDELSVQKFIADFREEFKQMSFEDVAFPRSVSELTKYSSNSKELVVEKGTPIHVRGSLVYNYLLQQHGLTKKYESIKDGEKIKFCYMKVPNPIGQNIISSVGELPKEFDMHKFIDYETQYEKSFVEPIRSVLECVGWTTEKQATLDDFFS